ncbi:MAG TPA: YtxH domain-containing protein [Dehalococcoidia bacterium]|nr:YtxH domain-containing protein [Dehalococcoidia bacterium]
MRFLLGLLLGIALGVAVGLVLAPQPGSETRKALREQLQKSGEDATGGAPANGNEAA